MLHHRSLGVELMAVGLPLLLVYVGRMLVTSPPPTTGAVQVAMPVIAPVAPAAAKPLTPEQQKATEWLNMLPPKYELASPLNHIVDNTPPPPVPQPVTPVRTNDPVPVPKVNPIQGLKLTGVLGNENEQLAAINGKIYHIGDVVRPGLKLTEIDPRQARIILTDDEGEKYEIKREQK